MDSKATTQGETRSTHPELTSDAPDTLQLTDRESQVMSELAKGLLYKEVAHKLGISFSAVHKHQHNIFAKLRVTNRTEAATRWLQSRAVRARC